MPDVQIIDLQGITDSLVIHYGGELAQVNAFTFGNSLLSICSIIEEINKELNPGFAVEINVEALGPGSFRPVIKTVAKSLKNLFSKMPQELILSVLGGIILHHIYPQKTEIIIKDDVVIVEGENFKATIPRQAYDSQKALENNQKIQSKVRETFEILDNDEAITNFGMAKDVNDKELMLFAPRQEFGRIAQIPEIVEDESRRIKREKVELTIVKPLLEKSKRKWQFIWNGVKISAVIKDEKFLGRVIGKEISFTFGDRMIAWMLIYQEKDRAIDEFVNIEYQIEEVIHYIASKKQEPLK